MTLIFRKYGTGEEIMRYCSATEAPVIGDTVDLNWTDKDHEDKSYIGTVVKREMRYADIPFAVNPLQRVTLTVS